MKIRNQTIKQISVYIPKEYNTSHHNILEDIYGTKSA